MKNLTKTFTAGVFLFAFLFGSQSASAQSAITFGAPSHEIDFPDSIGFEISAASSAGEIVTAEFTYWIPGEVSISNSLTSIEVEFTPGNSVQLVYIQDTEGSTVFPSTPYAYYWEVSDSAGNSVRSEEFSVRYDDTRFDWDILENQDVAVWTHDRGRDFGQRVFQIAKRAIELQYPLYQIDIKIQLRIIVYNNQQEFAEWHSGSVNSIGGEALPDFGVTTQIVTLGGFVESWLNDVIPHEISHLYFAQATYNPRSSVPTWLNEGVASYNEFNDPSRQLNEVERLGRNGELVPLSSLERGFGRLVDVDRFSLAYSEAVSAVTYMIESYGKDGLATLLSGYKSGKSTDDAFLAAFGVDATEFELGWAEWLGIPEGVYVIPTAWPVPTFPPSPTPFLIGASQQASVTPKAELAKAVSTPAPVPPSTPSFSGDGTTISGDFFTALFAVVGFTCCSILALIALILLLNKRRQSI